MINKRQYLSVILMSVFVLSLGVSTTSVNAADVDTMTDAQRVVEDIGIRIKYREPATMQLMSYDFKLTASGDLRDDNPRRIGWADAYEDFECADLNTSTGSNTYSTDWTNWETYTPISTFGTATTSGNLQYLMTIDDNTMNFFDSKRDVGIFEWEMTEDLRAVYNRLADDYNSSWTYANFYPYVNSIELVITMDKDNTYDMFDQMLAHDDFDTGTDVNFDAGDMEGIAEDIFDTGGNSLAMQVAVFNQTILAATSYDSPFEELDHTIETGDDTTLIGSTQNGFLQNAVLGYAGSVLYSSASLAALQSVGYVTDSRDGWSLFADDDTITVATVFDGLVNSSDVPYANYMLEFANFVSYKVGEVTPLEDSALLFVAAWMVLLAIPLILIYYFGIHKRDIKKAKKEEYTKWYLLFVLGLIVTFYLWGLMEGLKPLI